MTAQEVIKEFVAALKLQGYNTSAEVLDAAVRGSTRFDGIQAAVDSFLADREECERTAIKEILGDNSEYEGLQLTDLIKKSQSDTTLAAALVVADTYSDNPENYGKYSNGTPQVFTAAERIRMRTADLFLDKCGIILPHYVFRYYSTDTQTMLSTYFQDISTGNTDTGAITGSDAGGSTVEKNSETVVPEIANKYTATTSAPQVITTGTGDWVVAATSYGDTINVGGSDSIGAGRGADVINVTGDDAIVDVGDRDYAVDRVSVGSDVKYFAVYQLEQWDTLQVAGEFNLKSVFYDETYDEIRMVDKSGRSFLIGNWKTAKNATITVNSKSQKIGEFVSKFIEYEDTSTTETATATTTQPAAVTVDLSGVNSLSGNVTAADGSVAGTLSSEFPNAAVFTSRGLTFRLWGRSSTPETKDVQELKLEELTDTERNIFAGLYKWWAKEGLKLNEESFGIGFKSEDLIYDTIRVYFYSDDKINELAAVGGDGNSALSLRINLAQFPNISADNPNALGKDGTLLDRTLAHELNHAILDANIKNFDLAARFFSEGIAELVHGVDDDRIDRIWDLAAGITTDNEGTGTTRIKAALDVNYISELKSSDPYAGGYMFLRYLAKEGATQTASAPALGEVVTSINLDGSSHTYYANLTSAAETANTSSGAFTVGAANNYTYTATAGFKENISATSGNWNFKNIGTYNSITSGSGNDSVQVVGSYANINLGDGANSIRISTSNYATITSGSGNDSLYILYSSKNEAKLGDGDNLVSISSVKNNVIEGGSLRNTVTTGAGDDSLFLHQVSENYIDIGDGANFVSLINENHDNTVISGSGNDSVAIVGIENFIQSGAGDDSILFSNYDASIVSGNSLDAGEGNDTIAIYGVNNYANGGAGDDSIVAFTAGHTVAGGAGNDKFFLLTNEGTLHIEDFSIEDDALYLGYTASSFSAAEKSFTIDSLTIYLDNAENLSDFYGMKIYQDSLTDFKTLENILVSYDAFSWEVSGTTAKYGDVITITGVSTNAKAADFSLSGTTVSISANALDSKSTVTISEGYSLALGTDVTKSQATGDAWEISGGTATYTTAGVSAGFAVTEDNQIVYVAASTDTSTITVTGLKSTATAKHLSIDGNSVTVAAAAVQGNVTITDGYELVMGKGSYSNSTVTGGSGADSITNNGNNLVINTGAGNDLITLGNGAARNTINAGTGDDSITATKGKNLYQYANGDGNDVISGFTENDSLQITSGSISGWQVDGADLTFNIGEGSVKIVDGAGKKINTATGTAKAVAQIYGAGIVYNDKKTSATLDATFTDSYTAESTVISIDGSAATATTINGNSKANVIYGNGELNGDAGSDKLYGGAGADTLNGGKGNDTLTGGSGADIFVYETGGGNDVIADYAEEDKISVGAEISSVSTNSNDVVMKIGSGKLTLKNAVGKKVTANDETKIYEKGKIYDADKTSVTLTAPSTLDSTFLNVDASAISGTFKYTGNDSANLIIGGKGTDTLNGGAGNDTLIGGKGNDKLYGDAGDDVLDGGAGNDTLSGGAGNNTLTGGDGNDIFIHEGGNDLITDYTVKDKIKFAVDTLDAYADGADVVFKSANGAVTVQGGAGVKITTLNADNKATVQIYETGVNYNDKKTAATLSAEFTGSYTADSLIASIDGTAAGAIQITGNAKANKIYGGTGADTLYGGAGNDSIFGGDGNDSIFGEDGNDKLYGGAGADTLNGGKGNDTLTGEDGADVFVYDGLGNDVIADYAEEDRIVITSGEISKITVSSQDLTFKIGSGSLKIKNGVGQKITLTDSSGETYTRIYDKGRIYDGDKTWAMFTAAVTETLDSTIITVDGSAATGMLNVTGNDQHNSIVGSAKADTLYGGAGRDTIFGNAGNDKIYGDYGEDYLDGGAGNDTIYGGAANDTIFGDAGNDRLYGEDGDDSIFGGDGNDLLDGGKGNNTLDGGAGNDTLYGGEGNSTMIGGDGKDVFVYEGGNDWIDDYEVGVDKIKMMTEITDYAVSSPNVILKTANGNLTIRRGVGVELTIVDANNKTTKVTYNEEPQTFSRTIDLLHDNNFMTSDFALDDITESKYEVQNIETQDYTNLAQDDTILAYTDKK